MDAQDAARAILKKPHAQAAEKLQENVKQYMAESEGEKKYWGRVATKTGRTLLNAGPYETREEAVKVAFEGRPNAKEVQTGWGNQGGHFDIQWHKRELGEDNFKGYRQGAKEQGLQANLAKRGWALKDSGKLGATYVRKGVSIVVDKDAWAHQGASGKDTDSLESHLKSYFDKKEETEVADKEMNELSKGKLANYTKAAQSDASDRADKDEDDPKIDKRAKGSFRAIRKIGDKLSRREETEPEPYKVSLKKVVKEARARLDELDLVECLGPDTGEVQMEVREFPTASVKGGPDAFGGHELIDYHQRMMAHHEKLKSLATAYAGKGDADMWNQCAAAHAQHVHAHASWLDGINKSAKGFPQSGSPGGGVHEGVSYRDELLTGEL